ncbi:MAG: urease accessory protein UreD, partial [Akkermansiaceae bacterium]|nr:urease accessory protein UreD [Akkermansiaceae bacterium]
MNDVLTRVSGSSLRGHLELRCETRSNGDSYISHQSFSSPIHLGKSYIDQGKLVLNIVNPTAGFFDGDVVQANVSVGKHGQLVLSTPSAARVYRTRSGAAAANKQVFHIGENAFMEWIPEPFIPHAGARYVQETTIHLHPTANLLYFDWLAPGRVAMGEVFAYQQLEWKL